MGGGSGALPLAHFSHDTRKMVSGRCLLLHCVVASGRAGAASSCSCGTPAVGCATLVDMILQRIKCRGLCVVHAFVHAPEAFVHAYVHAPCRLGSRSLFEGAQQLANAWTATSRCWKLTKMKIFRRKK